jgi:CheY-like chemotaxis protein
VVVLLANKPKSLKKLKVHEKDRLRNNFIINMSHELRNPLNGILGMIQLLYTTELTSEQQNMINVIKNSSNNLLKTVDSLLDVSKMELYDIDVEKNEFNIFEAVNELTKTYNVIAKKKDLELNCYVDLTIPSILIGDIYIFKQILYNLLDNAIKFTKKGSVSLNLKKTKFEKNKVTVLTSIKDTGKGIQEYNLESIFKRFIQLENSTTKKSDGYGLGLTVTKNLIENLGGKISVDSKPNVGSNFSFELVFELPEINEVKKANSGYELIINKQLNILVVEDDPGNQLLLNSFFMRHNVNHEVASNAKQCFELLNKKQFDLIILDIQLPDSDGYYIAKKIRRFNDEIKAIPIIAVTAYTLKNTRHKCVSYGMNEYLAKPLNFKHLTSMINKYS